MVIRDRCTQLKTKLDIIDLPNKINALIEELDSPERLKKHLQIVYSTAHRLVTLIKQEWVSIAINEQLILFGAGTHDIGKTEIKIELFESGKEHEIVGKQILLKKGFSEEEARFAFTHGNWQKENLTLEDLLVSLADKIWKGKRIQELEEKVGLLISENIKTDYWVIYEKLDKIIEQISVGADKRLLWQNE